MKFKKLIASICAFTCFSSVFLNSSVTNVHAEYRGCVALYDAYSKFEVTCEEDNNKHYELFKKIAETIPHDQINEQVYVEAEGHGGIIYNTLSKNGDQISLMNIGNKVASTDIGTEVCFSASLICITVDTSCSKDEITETLKKRLQWLGEGIDKKANDYVRTTGQFGLYNTFTFNSKKVLIVGVNRTDDSQTSKEDLDDICRECRRKHPQIFEKSIVTNTQKGVGTEALSDFIHRAFTKSDWSLSDDDYLSEFDDNDGDSNSSKESHTARNVVLGVTGLGIIAGAVAAVVKLNSNKNKV